jgi:hypothetical protein
VIRPPRSGRLLTGALLLGAVGAALAPAGPDALVPFKTLAASAASTVCMGIVIDYGKAPSAPTSVVPPPPTTQRIDVASGSTDLDALNDANDAFALNGAGLVCTINNYPADGAQNCLANSNGQFFYWSYWQGNPGTNTWTYAGEGPASHAVDSGDTYVEGWTFQDPGPDNPSAPKPSVSPAVAFSSACPGIAPVTPPKTTTTTSPPPDRTSPGGSGSTATTTTAVGGGASTGAGRAGGAASSPGHGGTSVPSTTASPGGSGAEPASGVTSTSGAEGSAGTGGHSSRKTALASTAPHHGSAGSGNPALPLVVVAAVVALMGGLAWFRWRRRPAEE